MKDINSSIQRSLEIQMNLDEEKRLECPQLQQKANSQRIQLTQGQTTKMVSTQENESSPEVTGNGDSVSDESPAKQNVAKSLPQTNNLTGNISQDAVHSDVSMSPNIDDKYVIIIKKLKRELSNPLVLDKIFKEKLLEINITIFPSDSVAGTKIYFSTKSNKDRFLKAFKDRDFWKVSIYQPL